MKKRFSLYKVNSQEYCPFDEVGYSRFKFGDTYFARKFAEELFAGFIEKFGNEILSQKEIILFPSPFHSIPTASNFLCLYFKEQLNFFLYANDKSACIEGKIHRKQTYVEDYGNLDFEQRLSLISNDTYYIDKNFVNGKYCIFIDDIKITGSHEKTVDKILNDYKVEGEFIFLYFAELVNKEIHPNIENHYNYFAVKEAQDLVNIINSKDFYFNTRITKYILLMNEVDFELVCNQISEARLEQMLILGISNNYHQVDEYKINLNKLKNKTKWQSIYKKDNDKISMHQSSQ